MKNFLFALIFLTSINIYSQDMFEKYFIDKTFRIDYFHIGNNQEEMFTIDKLFSYGIWAGSRTNLIDNFNNGRYYIKIYDKASGTLIYSKGFDSYFGEYKLSEWGMAGIKKAYHESGIIPMPKKDIVFAIHRRNRENKLEEIFRTEINPNDDIVIKENMKDPDVIVVEGFKSGDPHKKVDVVILGEGYTKNEVNKFKKDLKKFTDILFKYEPYKSHKKDFNVYGVLKPSVETGVDEPESNIYKNSSLNLTFSSLGSERYLLTEDNVTMRNLAGHVPYDAIYIMANHKRYGGGGIYNLFCTFTSDNQWHEYLFVHEFGHSFGGLADEYYTSDVAYNEFYPAGVEPVEPNITSLPDPNNLKWKHLADKNLEVPAKWEKDIYDKTDLEWQAKRRELNKHVAELKRNKASKAEIEKAEEEYNQMDRDHNKVVNGLIENSKYFGKVGAFEGAGYASKGLYRPMLDCIMFSKGSKPFCLVCQEGIERVIKHYME